MQIIKEKSIINTQSICITQSPNLMDKIAQKLAKRTKINAQKSPHFLQARKIKNWMRLMQKLIIPHMITQ
jgi:hypothetical protein